MAARKFFQSGWVVPDIDQAVRDWASVNGVGPFYVRRGITSPGIEYRGRVTPLVVDIAIAQAGDMQVELIHQVNDDPSAYHDTYRPHEGGAHHLGAYSDDFDADLRHFADAGVALAAYGVWETTRFAYFDTRDTIGLMTELIDLNQSAALRAMFAEIKQASLTWDGADPFHELP